MPQGQGGQGGVRGPWGECPSSLWQPLDNFFAPRTTSHVMMYVTRERLGGEYFLEVLNCLLACYFKYRCLGGGFGL